MISVFSSYVNYKHILLYFITMQDGSIAFLLAKSQEKLEKFLVELNYSGDALTVS